MVQPPLHHLTGFRVYKSNLLKARMIITAYNDHVRLLSSEPLVGLRHQSLLEAWEPTLLCNHFSHNAQSLGSPGGSSANPKPSNGWSFVDKSPITSQRLRMARGA